MLGGAARAQQVTITDLELLPGGTYASAYAINDTGKILGIANDATGALQTVQWVNGHIAIMTDIVFGGISVPQDLDDAGEGVGSQDSGFDLNEGVFWDSQNNPSQLQGLPNGPDYSVHPNAMNTWGQIVGMAAEGAPNFWGHAVVWLRTSFQADLGFMGGGKYSAAYGIDDRGAVVGVAGVASGNLHAFLWQNGSYTDLSTWSGGSAFNWAYAINNHGAIVGLNNNVASIWENGAVHPLPMPPGISAYTPAIDINDTGDIIATGSKGYPYDVGVLWRNGVPVDLGTLPGGTISRARRINANGEVVGEANAASGYFHAVKWTITPARPWTDLGHALPGTAGVPLLSGSGDLSPSSSVSVTLSNGLPNGALTLVIGSSTLYGPLFGGVLVPFPNVILPHLPLGPSGSLTLSGTMPPGLPSGTTFYLQGWIPDPGGPQGVAASNALKATTP
ncbi:MAG: hypothetical protein U1E76_21400 [Planctomycetota bacterium]